MTVDSCLQAHRAISSICCNKYEKCEPHNEELNDLYFSHSIVWVIKLRRMRWVGHVAHMGDRRGVYRVLMGKLEGKSLLGRPRHRWEDNIKMDLQEVGLWTGSSWLRIGKGS
jgi:hypothetical protein